MTKSKTANRVRQQIYDHEEEGAPKGDLKMLVFGIWLFIIFGLMAAFLYTTSQNYDAPSGSQSASPTEQEFAAKMKSLQDKLAQNPNDLATLVEIGFLYYDNQEYQEAAANFQKATNMAPSNTDAMVGLGMAYDAINRPNDALRMFDKALQANPNADFAKVRKAYFLADRRQDYQTALKLLREAEARQPEGAAKNDILQAIADFEKKAK